VNMKKDVILICSQDTREVEESHGTKKRRRPSAPCRTGTSRKDTPATGGDNYSPKPEYGVIASMTQIFKEVSDDISSRSLPTRFVSVAALLRRYSPSPHRLLTNHKLLIILFCHATLLTLHAYVQWDQVSSQGAQTVPRPNALPALAKR
jgi:hypothetical protein